MGALRAGSMVKLSLQTHFAGSLSGSHPYLKLTASLNSLFDSDKLYFSRGNAVSQLEDPLF